ncbi:alpha/beta fold hydrolase [Marimonas lutisalis]|uniref:alpha/beta fold hydrolase n=1 Tax=Marimonas lutisalis TaxID=2545756 RepID=UPI0010F8554F|nr:alpha/beta hydrolase [Marimonas lutisalis]
MLDVDRSIRDDMTDEEAERFDNFYVVQRRDILEKARRSKYPARALWDPKQDSRINSAFDFSFHVDGETTTFDGPSLILAGRQDSMSGYLDAVDLLPQFTRATLADLDAAGHGLAWERPEVFNSLFLDWLERVDSCFLGATLTFTLGSKPLLAAAFPSNRFADQTVHYLCGL